MIYITGDTHGDQHRWAAHLEPVLSSGDILVITGDFGVGFWNGPYWSEELFYDHISQQPYLVLFVDGNHSNFLKLNSYPVEIWNGGRVHRLRHNLIHLLRGEVYSIAGRSFFAFGGGYSADKARRIKDISWWPEEMPSEEEYANARSNLEKAGYKVDYVVTHTAPSETVSYLSSIRKPGRKNNPPQERALNTFFDYVQENVTYKQWYFGHYHIDIQLWRRQTAIYNTVRELETGKITHQFKNL